MFIIDVLRLVSPIDIFSPCKTCSDTEGGEIPEKNGIFLILH